MQIDWFIVGAQLFNFLVLVFLLKRFLYKPVVGAMAAREKRITDRIAQAAERESKAKALQQSLSEKIAAMDSQREAMVAKIHEQVDGERQHLMEAMRDEVAKQRAAWRDDANRENEEFARELRHEVADAVLALSRRALADLADAKLEHSIVEHFLAQLRALDPEQQHALSAFRGPLTVATSFEIDPDQRAAIAQALRDASDAGGAGAAGDTGNAADAADARGAAGADARAMPIRWVRDERLLCGLRVRAEGFELGWAIDDYLDDVRERVSARLAHPHA